MSRTLAVIAVTLAGCGQSASGLFADPGSITFDHAPLGEARSAVVTVRNAGSAAVHIARVAFDPASAQLTAVPAEQNGCAREDLDLGGGEACVIELTYVRAYLGPYQRRLVFYDRDGAALVDVPIRATAPRLAFEPEAVDFVLRPDAAAPAALRLVNTGDEEVPVSAPRIEGSTEFALTGGAAGVLGPGEAWDWAVEYREDPEASGLAEVVAEPDTETAAAARAALSGTPIARASAEPQRTRWVRQPVALDSAGSRGPGETVYAWRALEFPDASVTAPQFNRGETQDPAGFDTAGSIFCRGDQRDAEVSCFHPDNPGRYRFELRVGARRAACGLGRSGDGCRSDADCCALLCEGGICAEGGLCDPAGGCTAWAPPVEVEILAIPNAFTFDFLHEADEDDWVYVHLLRDAGAERFWGSLVDDCHRANLFPDWGEPRRGTGQPCTSADECRPIVENAAFCRCLDEPCPNVPRECVDALQDPFVRIEICDESGVYYADPPPGCYHVGLYVRSVSDGVTGNPWILMNDGPWEPLGQMTLAPDRFWYVGRFLVGDEPFSTTFEAEPIDEDNPSPWPGPPLPDCTPAGG
ncbi:MAG: hypothetical protein AABZ30_09895 [Myxococcota bacterium]